jgi:GNAT superfamily N-acetyltransferase
MAGNKVRSELAFHPLTRERWDDFEKLFMSPRAPHSCWCMWWRLTTKEFNEQIGERNKDAMCLIVACGRVPGILAYAEGEPVGWCSVAPREEFPRLDRSPLLKPVDDEAVWSIVCFYVLRKFRSSGVMRSLIDAAVEHARANGARIVEAYPLDAGGEEVHSWRAYRGLARVFVEAGFVEVARRRETRPVMRKTVG